MVFDGGCTHHFHKVWGVPCLSETCTKLMGTFSHTRGQGLHIHLGGSQCGGALSLFQRKNRWSMAWVYGPVVMVLKELVLTSDPKPQFPKQPKNQSKGAMIMLSFENQN